ncbi:MAG TPA: hypothetical protein VLM38_14905 [Blastocatellia bacterium]|nr:hypothetical protein [Blastocatellia bacterium]
MLLTEISESTNTPSSSPQVRVRLLEQMAEALEDEAAVLYRRAAAFEEDEFLLNREIEERQTEINRLQLKLDAMRSERDRVMEKIESISEEATAMRYQAFNRELAQDSPVNDSGDETQQQPTFFRRAALEQPGLT